MTAPYYADEHVTLWHGDNHDDTRVDRDRERAARHDAESAPERLHPDEEQHRLGVGEALAEIPCRGAR